jgi:dTDP-glucose 4,6-dehydratase
MAVGKRALVTGAAGFIGSHLVELLVREGYEVRAFTHYNAAGFRHNLDLLEPEIRDAVEVVAGDIADPFSTDEAVADRDVVFHLAALIAIPYSYVAPAAYVATNVTGTLNVLQACRRRDVSRLVHTSTSETYGSAQYAPMDEKHPLVGQSPYSASKIAADKLAESFHRSYGLPVITVRPFNTYGPRQSARAVVPTIVCQALRRDEIRLGSLSPVRDMTYAADTAAGFLAAAQCDEAVGEVVNLGTGAGVSIGDLAAKVLALVGRDLPVRTDEQRIRPEASEVRQLISDNAKMKRLTGWTPRVNLDDGLQRVIEFVDAHPALYRPEIYNV